MKAIGKLHLTRQGRHVHGSRTAEVQNCRGAHFGRNAEERGAALQFSVIQTTLVHAAEQVTIVFDMLIFVAFIHYNQYIHYFMYMLSLVTHSTIQQPFTIMMIIGAHHPCD